jgi:hypothetical protein
MLANVTSFLHRGLFYNLLSLKYWLLCKPDKAALSIKFGIKFPDLHDKFCLLYRASLIRTYILQTFILKKHLRNNVQKTSTRIHYKH